jgi:glycyl-tRNA synthetase
MTASSVDTIVSLAKRRGFVFPSGEIYGGTRSAWDYGPLGVELKDNIKRQWWKAMVQGRDDIVGLDSSVILPRAVWDASGHVSEFVDPLVECQSCHRRFRADHLQEAHAEKKGIDDPDTVDLATIACSNCGAKGSWTEPKMFNGLLKTFLGPVESEEGLAYLRPETAQGIFVNFKQVMTSARRKPPFGIGQIGKSFRNEITPGNFIFRTREFEQMEMEFFVEPGTDEQWHETWLQTRWDWYTDLGIDPENLRFYEHPAEKLSHYSKRTVDIEYRFKLRRQRVRRARGHRQPHRLRPHHPLQALRGGPELLRPGEERALDPVRDRARGRRQPVDDGVPDGCLHRGRCAQRQGWRGQAHGAAAGPAAGPGEGRGAAAVAQRRPHAQGARPCRAAAAQLELRLRRRRCDRAALPPSGRGRHAVLRDRRLRDPRRPRRDRAERDSMAQERIGLDQIVPYLAMRLVGA